MSYNWTRYFARIFMILVAALGLGALSVRAEYFYVATNGAATDFRSWITAATNIQDAVNVATNGDVVLVSNGVYTTTTPVLMDGTNNIVALTNRITLKSVNGPAMTVIDGNYPALTARVVFVSQKATLDGFTVRKGRIQHSSSKGGGISIANGTVTNCIVHNNYSAAYGGGISVYDSTGIVANCTIYSNSCTYDGGGIYLGWTSTGTMVNNCVIWRNKTTWFTSGHQGGGGLHGYSSQFSAKNCLFYQNESYVYGGGVAVSKTNVGYYGVFENCTIAGNSATNAGGGFSTESLSTQARNLIIYNNIAGNYADAWTTNQNVLTNSCIRDTNGVPNWNTSGNITNNPQFIDAANNNYRLLASSPCINTGTNQAWMTDGVDLDGRPRIRYRWVDMGAYEHINRGTIYGFQ